jgi:hypothetical protein
MLALKAELTSAQTALEAVALGIGNNAARNEQRLVIRNLEEMIVSKDKFLKLARDAYKESQERGRLYTALSAAITEMLGPLKERILQAKSTVGYTDTSMSIHDVINTVKALAKAAAKLETFEVVEKTFEIISRYKAKTMYSDFPTSFIAQAAEWYKLRDLLIDSDMEAKLTPSEVRQFMLELIPAASDGSTACRDECASKAMPAGRPEALVTWVETAYGIVSRYAKHCQERPLTKIAGAVTRSKDKEIKQRKESVTASVAAACREMSLAELERIVSTSVSLPIDSICPLHPTLTHGLHGCWTFAKEYCQRAGSAKNPKYMERMIQERSKQGSAWKGYAGN